MLNKLKKEANIAYTDNGALSYETTGSDCLDLFSTIGALRHAEESEIINRFLKAYIEDKTLSLKILFFARDIRFGLGERRIFRIIINWLAKNDKESLLKNLELIPEYGRYDDLLSLLETNLKEEVIKLISKQLKQDLNSETVSLLGKWLPSINASSKETTNSAKIIIKELGISNKEYRQTLSLLRNKIRILENNLREKDYDFDYSKVPSRALLKYQKAFIRNDNIRYQQYLEALNSKQVKINSGNMLPYDIVRSCLNLRQDENFIDMRKSLDTIWHNLEDFTNAENALAVVDNSGSMYWDYYNRQTRPIDVAFSLGIYFAQRNKGPFHNHYISFSRKPRLMDIKGNDIYEKVKYCASFNEVANTNLQAVFDLILNTAKKYKIPKKELPKRLYIISDMEFDACIDDKLSNYEYAKAQYILNGYKLPEIIFWNVNSFNRQQPVTKLEKGVALVSGINPRIFKMVVGEIKSPQETMMAILNSERYKAICA